MSCRPVFAQARPVTYARCLLHWQMVVYISHVVMTCKAFGNALDFVSVNASCYLRLVCLAHSWMCMQSASLIELAADTNLGIFKLVCPGKHDSSKKVSS